MYEFSEKKIEIKRKHFFSFSASFAIQRMIQKNIHKSPTEQVQISVTVKTDQAYPHKFYHRIHYLKIECITCL